MPNPKLVLSLHAIESSSNDVQGLSYILTVSCNYQTLIYDFIFLFSFTVILGPEPTEQFLFTQRHHSVYVYTCFIKWKNLLKATVSLSLSAFFLLSNIINRNSPLCIIWTWLHSQEHFDQDKYINNPVSRSVKMIWRKLCQGEILLHLLLVCSRALGALSHGYFQ